MIKVLVRKLKPSVKLPSYKTNGASGMDLMAYIDKPIELKPGDSCLVPTGLSVAFPKEYEIQIRPRSGLAAKNNISVLNTPGTIDSDYSCLLYTSPSPRDPKTSRMPSSA